MGLRGWEMTKQRHRDLETQGSGDAGARRHRDLGDPETQGPGDAGARRRRGLETQGSGDAGTRRPRGLEMQESGDTVSSLEA